jgi:uncharacterized delta-60 repeat protein
VQSDGKIVIAGASGSDFVISRYNPNGTLDASFGNGGRLNTDFPQGTSSGAALVIQPDGKIVVAGQAIDPASPSLSGFALVRYNPNGALDTSFDGDGRVVTLFGYSYSGAADIVLQPDGKLVVAGTSLDPTQVSPAQPPSTYVFAIARYNTDGSLDTSFDGDGRVTTDIPGLTGERAQAVAIQANGRIVAAGIGAAAFVLTRYNTNGSLDSGAAADSTPGDSFGSSGFVNTAFGGIDEDVRALAIQPDGKIIAAGQTRSSGFSGNNNQDNFALARYNSDGSLDNTFDTDGKVTTDFGLVDKASDVIVQPDGRIVAAGNSRTDAGLVNNCVSDCQSFFSLARYNPNGSLDNTFDGDGRVLTDIGGGRYNNLGAFSVALQTDGRIIAAGEATSAGQLDFGVARYNMDGSLDTANFGTGGMVTTDFPLNQERLKGLVIQADGKIVAVGRMTLQEPNSIGAIQHGWHSGPIVWHGWTGFYRLRSR